jgi:hypothetical protein
MASKTPVDESVQTPSTLSPIIKALSASPITWRHIQHLSPSTHRIPASGSGQLQAIRTALLERASSRHAELLYYDGSETSDTGLRECGHGFYSAFHDAWATHGNVVLAPDDVWQAVQLQFARYVDANAEALRGRFVEHDGKMELRVKLGTSVTKDWPLFMRRTVAAIQSKLKTNVADDLMPTFSTSTPLTRSLQRLAVMDCMQRYFSYTGVLSCGIENVGFLGTLDDWQLLRRYVAGLSRFHVKNSRYFNSLEQWVKDVLVIVDQFIASYEGNMDVEWWDGWWRSRQVDSAQGRRATSADGS